VEKIFEKRLACARGIRKLERQGKIYQAIMTNLDHQVRIIGRATGRSAAHASLGFTHVNVDTRRRLEEACQSLLDFAPLIRIGHQHNVVRPVLKRNSLKNTLVRILYSEDLLPVGAVVEEGPHCKCCAPIQIVWRPRHSPMRTGLE